MPQHTTRAPRVFAHESQASLSCNHCEYGYEDFFVNNMLYFQVIKGMYGLPQAGLFAQNLLIANIAKHGYTHSDIVPCLFWHATDRVTFVVVNV
jgi:hypothetical protein